MPFVAIAPAKLDELTQLPVRPEFEALLQNALTAARKQGQPVSVAVLDLDFFGRLNDKAGTEAGDRALNRLAARIAAHFQGRFQACRFGGDAFAVLLEGEEKEQAFLQVEKLRGRLAEAGGEAPGITVSAGVASYPEDGAKAIDVLNKACEALYRAKVSGRDKVCLSREEKMVTKTSHYTQGQLLGLRRLAEREGIGEAVLLREGLNDLLRKHNA